MTSLIQQTSSTLPAQNEQAARGDQHMVISVLYICQNNLSIRPQIETLTVTRNPNGRAIIPAEFKRDKNILAVMKGEVELLNSLGDRAERNRDNRVA